MEDVSDEIKQKVLRIMHTVPTQIPWDEIETGVIYHVPRVYTQPSIDILVTEKHVDHITCYIKTEGVTYVNQRLERGNLSIMLMSELKNF